MAGALVLPLIVIVGPTASGKSSLALKLAHQCNGEIICADSRTLYRETSIGTAKPSVEDQALVPHWGIDLVDPNEPYSVADFKSYALEKITEIRARGHIPFLVGGSGLYIDAILFDYQFGPAADPTKRTYLESLSIEELWGYCKKNDILLPENYHNKRYVIRAIEQNGINVKRRKEPITTSIIVGIATETDELKQRIRLRTEQLFHDGVVEEATKLGKKYHWNAPGLTGNIYPLVHLYLEEKWPLTNLKDKFTTADWHLARRQRTWFKRNKFIQWLSLPEAEAYLFTVLAREGKE